MALSTVVLLIAIAAIYFPLRNLLNLYKHIRLARTTGLPYIVSPTHFLYRPWAVFSFILIPLLQRLPSYLVEPWIHYVDPEWVWKEGYNAFSSVKRPGGVGADSFLIATPHNLHFVTADAGVIKEVAMRRLDFQKPVEVYKGINLYGVNVVAAEGAAWRRQRRIAAAQFGEKNNKMVWKESLFHAREMLWLWKRETEKQTRENEGNNPSKGWSCIVEKLSHDTMRLSLYVISRAGFGVQCTWPGQKTETPKKTGSKEDGFDATEVPTGFTMSYMESLEKLLQRIILFFVLGPNFVRSMPFKFFRNSYTAFVEWGKYMQVIYDRNFQEASGSATDTNSINKSSSAESTGMELMGAMIRSSGQIPGTPNYGKPGAGLSQAEIIGNSFVMFLAGHETAANSIHFSMLYLAMHPSVQRTFQKSLDALLPPLPASSHSDPAFALDSLWTYDTHLPALQASLAGAIMNEQLRLTPPVTGIPKCVTPHTAQTLTVDGRPVVLPARTLVTLHAVGTQRNPKAWPHGPATRRAGPEAAASPPPNDLEEFRPERWFVRSAGWTDDLGAAAAERLRESMSASAAAGSNGGAGTAAKGAPAAADEDEDLAPEEAAIRGGVTGSQFVPAKGAYIPFSEGPRSCIGRRFAQVEILAVLAYLFKSYSVELYVEGMEREFESWGEEERLEKWQTARAAVERKMKEEMGTIITLQLRGKGVKVRLCERGAELFDYPHGI